MARWLANLSQAVQDRLESLVDDSDEHQESAQHVQSSQNEASVTDAVDAAVGINRDNAPVSVAVDGTDDQLVQLEEQKALIDALKALIREKESKNFEQEQLIKEMQGMQLPDFGGRTAELERTIEELRLALRAKEEFVQTLHEQQARFGNRQPAATEQHESADVGELMRSVSKKDNAILRLQDRIQELEQRMMDLQELVNEKDEVIHGRDQAIKVMQEQLATRDSALKQSSDSYVALKAEFTSFQEWFAAQEGTWSERLAECQNAYVLAAGRLEQAQKQLLDMQVQYTDALSGRDAAIAELQAAIAEQKSQSFRSADPDVLAAKASAATAVTDEEAATGHVEAAAGGTVSTCSDDPRDKELAALKKSLHEQSTKMLKIKAQALAKVKALQKDLEDAKQVVPSAVLSAEVLDLQNRIAEIEEEKGNLQLQLVDMDEVKTTCAKLTQELEVTMASLRQAQLENKDLTLTLEDFKQASAHSVEAGETAQAQHTAEIALLRSELQELQQQYDSVATDVVAERDRSNRLSAELRSALTSLDEMQRCRASHEEETTSLRTRLNHLDVILAAATEAKVTSELRMAELEETRDGLLKEKAELVAAVGNLERQLVQQQLVAAAAGSARDDGRAVLLHRECDVLQQSHARLQQSTQAKELIPLVGRVADATKLSNDEVFHVNEASAALAGQLQATYDEAQRPELTADSTAACLSEIEKVECEEISAAGLLDEAMIKQVETEATDAAAQGDPQATMDELRRQHAEALSGMQAELALRHEEQIVALRQLHADAVAAMQAELQRRHEEQIVDLRRQHAGALAEKQAEQQQHHEEQMVDLRQQHTDALPTTKSELQRRHDEQIVDLQQQHTDAFAAMQVKLQQRYEEQVVDLRQQHAGALVAMQTELQQRHEEQIAVLRQHHAGALAAMQAELHRRHEEQVISLEQQHSDAVSSLNAKHHAELASINEAAAAAELQHDNAVIALQKELGTANARIAVLEQEAAVAAREAGVSAASWSQHRTELEQQLSAYRESQSLLADQLRVLIDERSCVDAAAARDRQELERANTLACSRLFHVVTEGRTTLPGALIIEEPATVEDAIRLGESTISALREKLQATEDRLALLQQEHSVHVDKTRADVALARLLPASLLAKAAELLPRENQPTVDTAAADWCACLLDELVEWRARLESTAAELKASSIRHAEKITSLASNLQEVEAQLTASASEAESLRTELNACRQQLACAEAEALQKQQQSAALAGPTAAAAEHEANLRKYAAAIKKLKADLVVKEKEATAASDLRTHLSERLHALLLYCRARAVAAGLRPDGSSGAAAGAAYGCDDSGLDASMSLPHDPLLTAVGEPPATLTIDTYIDLVQQWFEATSIEMATRCAAADDAVADLRRSLARRDAELQDLLQQAETRALDDARRAAELETVRLQADAGAHLVVQLDEARAEAARLGSELNAARTRCEQIELSARDLAQAADSRCRAAEAEHDAQQAASRARSDKMLAKLRQLKDRCDELQNRLDAAEARADAAEAATAVVADSRQRLEERCTTTERDAAAAAIAASAETTALLAELNRVRTESAAAVADVEAQLATHRQAAAEVEILRERADRALAAHATAEAEAAELRLQVDDALQRQAFAEAEAAKLHLQIDEVLRRQAAAEAEAAKLCLQVDGALAAKAAAEAEAVELRSQVEEALQRQAAAEAETSRVLVDSRNEQQVLETAAEARAALLRSRIEELSAAAEHQSAQLAALETSRLETVAALANERRQLSATLDMERLQAQRERLVLEQRVAEAEECATRAQLDAEVQRSAASEQRQSLERRLTEAQSQYSMLEADHREFERVAATLREAKVRLEREAHDLRRRLSSGSGSSSVASMAQSTIDREVVQPLGSAAGTTTALMQKQHTSDIAAHHQSSESGVAGRTAPKISVTVVERLEALCVLAASVPTAARDAPPQPLDANDVEACFGFLHDRVTQLLAVATQWQAEQAQLLTRQQATNAELQRRDRDCQQLAAKVQELSQSLQSLSQQHSQATAALQHATLELQHLQGLQHERRREHSPSRDHALLTTRIAELEASCQRLEKDLHEARQRDAGSVLPESGGASTREHSVYIEDSDANDPSASNELSMTDGITGSEQLPLLRRAGRLVEQGVPLLRAITRRQASRLRRLLRSQPRPQLLLLAYAFLLHVLVLGACFGNWFCP